MAEFKYVIEMDCKVLSIFIFLLYVKPEIGLAIAIQKLNYKKDMTEYCRRRVMPSVFLGKQVMETSSYIMHFSQSELPYSCMLSVRTESGSNIILVIQLLSGISLLEACNQNSDQLIVYEFGETFGGYWGNLPDTMMKETTRNYTQFYTEKTTKATTTTSRSTKNYKIDTSERILMQKQRVATDRPKDFIRMEIPLVNVSGNFQLGPPLQTYNAEEMFDFIYDVTPRNGVEYETSVLPLLQFSIKTQKMGQGSYDMDRRYDLDYAINGFTFDSRLLFSTINKPVSTKKKNWPTSRRLNFRKKNSHKLFTPRPTSSLITNRIFTRTLDSSNWNIEEISKTYSITTMSSTVVDNITTQNILDKISIIDHNFSVYLTPNLSIYENNNFFTNKGNGKLINIDLNTQNLNGTKKNLRPVELSVDREIDHLTNDTTSVKDQPRDIKIFDNRRFTLQTDFRTNESSYSKSDENKLKKVNEKAFRKINETNNVKVIINADNTVKSGNLNNDVSKTNEERVNNRSNIEKSDLLQRGRLVDHESWENIVQAAPVIAVVLNKTTQISNNITRHENVEKSNKKKRHIQAIEIESSRPKNLTTQRTVATEADMEYQVSDMQDLAGLVELQDDEIAGRLALRYLRNYVGSVMFNICDFQEAKTRQVFLFNASRIVIAINNFTLESMTLILTPAQSLLGSLSLCGSGYLECQIVGSRVCIDSMNACDGVPNCGSFDIYDEDRLKCGVTEGLQHNVYLAALTFLAVILTMLYTVHYWLKRCVPKVSEAFFIYSDVSENTLLLETIMRSPKDTDEIAYKISYPEHFFSTNSLYRDGFKEADLDEKFCKRIMRKCCGLLFCKKKRSEHFDYTDEVYSAAPLHHSRDFSFAEFELRKFAQTNTKDEAVQTGDSIEMQFKKRKRNIAPDSLDKLKIINYQGDRDKYKDELKLIKFAKETKSSSQCDAISIGQPHDKKMARRDALTMDDEKEIKSTLYVRESNITDRPEKILVKCEVHTEKPKRHLDATKKLRFDEELTMIPSMGSGGEITVHTMDSRRSVMEGQSSRDLDAITQAEGSEGSGSRDFMRFWETVKGKKGKKRKEKQLPMRFN